MSVATKFRTALGEHNFFGFRWIIEKFNDYDVERIKEIGKDRGCAEWLLRCGGTVRFDRYKEEITDYNSLISRTAIIDPRKPEQQVLMTAAHAVNASITARGCRHFEGLSRLHDARFVGCKNLEDEGIKTFVHAVGPQVRTVEVSNCRYITDEGVLYLAKCSNLDSVIISDLKRVKNAQQLADRLKEALPGSCSLFYRGVSSGK